MPTYTTSTTSYTFNSGVLGNLVLTTNQSDVADPYQNMTVVSASGTIDGHTVTGVSNFDNPNNLSFYENPVGYGADGSVHYDPYVDGFSSGYIFSRDYDNYDPGKPNGVSITTQDGINYHFYVAPATTGDASHPYELDYRDSSGNAGKITDDVVFRTVCFAKGVRILCDRGEQEVETIRAGDRLITFAGEVKEVIWVGHMVVRPYRLAKPEDAWPVRITAGALAEGVPARDLVVSPGHAIYIEGGLVRACDLVNGATICQERCDFVEYYHVELANHDIIVAEGTPCESYLDDGNRESFGNSTVSPFRKRIDNNSQIGACAPFINAEDVLTEIRTDLLERATSLGWQESYDAQFKLVVGGVELTPVAVTTERIWFALPASNNGVFQLRAESVRVNRVTANCSDERSLSVAIGKLIIDGHPISFNSAAWGAGFFPVESSGSNCWRWMGSEATLAFEDKITMVEISLAHVAPKLKLDHNLGRRPAAALRSPTPIAVCKPLAG